MASKNVPATPKNIGMERVRELFASKNLVNMDDDEMVQLRMVERIFQAETADDILNAGGGEVTHVRDVLGIPFHIYDVDWQESDFDESVGVYAVFHATNMLTGEKEVLTCGATNVCSAALALKERGFLPQDVKFVEASKPTSKGYVPLWMRPLTEKDRSRIAAGGVIDTTAEEPFT